MLWKTHKTISTEVLRRLGISLAYDIYQSYINGVVYPDKLHNPPHHYGKTHEIEKNLSWSREYFLRDNLQKAYFYLGVALHYIQDSYTSVESYSTSRKGQMIHHNWEIAIDQNRIVDDSELQRTIYNALRDNPYQRNRCLDIANILSRSALGRQQTCHVATLSGRLKSRNSAKPIVDLNLGLKASYVVTESVLSSKTHRTLEAQLRNAHSQHLACMNTSEIESSNQIIQHVKERDHLINNKDTGAGAASKIKNWVAGVQIGFKDRAITSEYSNYICRKHLTNIAESYGQVINEKVQLYGNWYICSAPPLNIDVVKRDLLPIQEIARVTGATEQSIKDLLKNSDVHSFSIGNHELIRRPDMERILSQSTLNGITLGLIEKDKPILL